MIVWLASYPRSGNTLLRQVLKKCMGLNSFESLGRMDHEPDASDPSRTAWNDLCGFRTTAEEREAFYDRASTSPEPFLVKTHEPPRDDQKAIYVVRDGRLALESLLRFQRTYVCATANLCSLLFSHPPYDNWTDHYRHWQLRRQGHLLVLRFEELVECSRPMLEKIAKFIGYEGPLHDWENPQARLQEVDPKFFGQGRACWRPSALWSDFNLGAFFTVHGELMVELAYTTSEEARHQAFPPGSDQAQQVQFIQGLTEERGMLQRACAERAAVIDALTQKYEGRPAQSKWLGNAPRRTWAGAALGALKLLKRWKLSKL